MILKPDATYTFSQIFELAAETDEVLSELGYAYTIAPLNLIDISIEPNETLSLIRTQMRDRLPYVPLANETARREFYISPVLFAVLDQIKFKLSIEYTVTTEKLRGDVDYLLRGNQNIIVVEAKRADMERGFTQLAAEMIAFSQYRPDSPDIIYGAITTGDLWQFGVLQRQTKQITKDMDEYLLPRDLEQIFGILLRLLQTT